jgi:hypothetical protein
MPPFRPALLVSLIAAAAPATAAESFRILYAERLELDDATGPAARASDAGPAHVRFDAYGRRFDLVLESNARVLGAPAGAAQPWRGSLAGQPGSWVRWTAAGARRWGMVWDGHDLYVVEPAREARRHLVGPAPADGDAPVVYRLSDTLAGTGAACATVATPATDATVRTGLDAYRDLARELAAAPTVHAQAAAAGAPTKRLQVSAVADWEYASVVGTAAALDRIVARFNNVDGIFSAQVGVQIQLAGTRVYGDAREPFDTTAASTLLTEVGTFRSQWVASSPADAGGVTHLLTGRNLDGTTVGIAYVGSLCSTRYGVSLSEGLSSYGDLIAAHELGHNFGAPHDGEVPADGSTNPCSSVPQTYLMAPAVNGSRTFSQCSLDQMAPTVAAATCLLPAVTTAPTVDLAVATAAGSAARALVGRTATLPATVSNAGTAASGSARLALAGTGVTFLDGTASGGGTCTATAGGLDCTWATLPAGATASVSVSVRAAATGSYPVTATASTAGDANAANDVAQWTLAVDPLPDLALDLPFTTAATSVGQSTTVAATVRNPGSATADGGTLTLDLPSALSPGTSLPAGCSAAAQRILCTVGALAGGAAASFSIPVLGAAAGSGDAHFSLASPDDASPGNDAGSVGVTVAAATAPAASPAPAAAAGSSGGGGAFGGAELLALGALGALRRRRAR